MFRSFSVAAAVAVGTPGIGNVIDGLLPSHVTDVLPIVITSAASFCGRGVMSGAFRFEAVPNIADFHAPCGLAHRRIIRSSTVFGIGVALPLPAMSSAPGMSSFQAYAPLRSSIVLQLWPFGRVPTIWIRSDESLWLMLVRYLVRLQGCPSTCIVPLPV